MLDASKDSCLVPPESQFEMILALDYLLVKTRIRPAWLSTYPPRDHRQQHRRQHWHRCCHLLSEMLLVLLLVEIIQLSHENFSVPPT